MKTINFKTQQYRYREFISIMQLPSLHKNEFLFRDTKISLHSSYALYFTNPE